MGNSILLKNGNVLLPDGDLRTCHVLAEDGRISEIGEGLHAEREIDASDAYVLPGLIDLHTHGLRRESAGDGSLAALAHEEASCGATTFYPTLFAPPDEIAAQMRRHRAETDELRQVPQVGGFRLESPYLATTGAGISKDLAPISPKITEMLLEAGGGHIKIWDISPELPGAPELIRRLSAQGIVCSIAHTRAGIEQGKTAVDAGARLVTHLYDVFGMPEVTEPGAYPAGLTDYLLVEDRVACEIIGDGTHVNPLLVEKAFRCKGASGIAFITDSNRGAGLPPGRYSLGEWGDVAVKGPNDGLRMANRGMKLAGSALTPIDSFRNAVRMFGKDIATASRMTSTTPAAVMGLNKGSIAVGKDADLIVLSADLELLYTISGGEIVYRKGQE
jgi:N-acetylglucosamine-6-phosphate deacetylase